MDACPAAICDDEIVILPYMETAITRIFAKKGVTLQLSSYSSSETLWRDLCSGHSYRLYFLDIDIPVCDGIHLAEKIRRIQPDAVILFVSAKEDQVFDTFKVSPAAFIRKEHFQADLETAAALLYRNFFHEEERFCTLADSLGHAVRINPDQLIYLKAMDKYVNLVMVQETLLMRQTLSILEDTLKPFAFIRIHKSYLVNHRYIYKLEKGMVFLDNGERLPISRYRIADVRKQFCLLSE